MPTNYFIDQLVKYLDTLENSPQYGKKSIYGDSDATTSDQKIDMIAKLLYYQNSTRPERIQQSTVAQDMTEIKESFDINQKTSQVARTYLTEGNNQGKFITPVYDNTGYEVGYINSDGDDYISAKPTPAFIQQIQAAQEKSAATNKIGITAADPDNSQENLQAEVDSCE